MESSIIPLEIYFEHRSYFPALLIFFAVAVGLVQLAKRYRAAGIALILVLCAGLSVLTYQRASLWGQSTKLAVVWARENPRSVRAQTVAYLKLLDAGMPRRALHHLKTGLRYHPNSITLQMSLRGFRCMTGRATPQPRNALLHALRTGHYTFTVYKGLREYMFRVDNGFCGPAVGVADVLDLVNETMKNPIVMKHAGAQSNLWFLKGQALLLLDKAEAATRAFEQAMALHPAVGLGLRQAALLASAEQYEAALAMLNRAEAALQMPSPDNVIQHVMDFKSEYYASEIQRLRKLIRADAKAASRQTGPSGPGREDTPRRRIQTG